MRYPLTHRYKKWNARKLFCLLFFCIFLNHTNAKNVHLYDGTIYCKVMDLAIKHLDRDTIRNDNIPFVTSYPMQSMGSVNVFISSYETCRYATIYLADDLGNNIIVERTNQENYLLNLSKFKIGEYYLCISLCDYKYFFKVVKTTITK